MFLCQLAELPLQLLRQRPAVVEESLELFYGEVALFELSAVELFELGRLAAKLFELPV